MIAKPGGLLLRLAALLLLTGCGSTSTRMPEHVVLRTAGPTGQSFHASLKIDGAKQEFDGVSPAEYEFECIRLAGEITKTAGGGELGFQITGTNFMCTLGGLDLPGSRISVEYQDRAVGFRRFNFHRNP